VVGPETSQAYQMAAKDSPKKKDGSKGFPSKKKWQQRIIEKTEDYREDDAGLMPNITAACNTGLLVSCLSIYLFISGLVRTAI